MEGFCRGCLIRYDDPMEMLQYTEKYRRLFVYSTGLQVKRNDTITFQLCKECFLNMKSACKFKKICRASDKKLKSYLALKDVGDCMDFCTFLKNNDDSMAFRLPMTSGNSTPFQHNKLRDDDNESTCTSIRNFMTDILQGEEMPDTEARIIREVIEEEADVLDDSLDSHWLQDDASIDTDFRLDFSLSPFATPNAIQNDHCYTPKRLCESKEEQLKKYFTSISPAQHHRDVNDLTDFIRNNQSEKELCVFGTDEVENEMGGNFDMPVIESDHADHIVDNDEQNINNLGLTNEHAVNNLDLPIYGNEKSITFNLSVIEEEKSLKDLDLSSLPSLPSIDNDKSVDELDLPTEEREKSINSFDLPSIPSINNEKSINDLDLPIKSHERTLTNFDLTSIPSINNEKSVHDFDLPSIPSIVNEKSLNSLDLPSLPSIPNENSINDFDVPIKKDHKAMNSYVLNLENMGIENNDLELKTEDHVKTIDLSTFGCEKSTKNIDLHNILSISKEKSNKYFENATENNDLKLKTDLYLPNKGRTYVSASKEIERIIDCKKYEKEKPCPIDKNLKRALKNEDNQEFLLDELLVTPKGSHENSGASTPTIANILFGDNLSLIKKGDDVNPQHLSKHNQEDIQEFLQNHSEEMDIDDKKEIIDSQNEFKVPMPVDENDIRLKKKTKRYTFLSEFDEGQFDLENFYCFICEKKFKTCKALCIHFVKKHNIKIIKKKNMDYRYKPRICSFCGKEFKDLMNYHRHLKIHTKKDQEPQVFKCTTCSLEFSAQSKLNKHLVSHKNMPIEQKMGKYVCTVCGATSTTIGNFRLHQRRHTNNYKHICSQCDKGFYRLSDFTVHMRSHTGEKPFPCNYCDKSFSRKDALTIHVKYHIDNKPFQCEYCEKNFINRSQLNLHLKVSVKCKQKRGIFIDKTTLVKNNTKDCDTEIEDESEKVGENDILDNQDGEIQLPYIDTEMSN